MNSAGFGVSANTSNDLNDILDLTGGLPDLGGSADGGDSSVVSGTDPYEGIGLEATEAEASFSAVDSAGASGETFSSDLAAASALDAGDAASLGAASASDAGDMAGGGDFADAAPGPAASLSTLATYLTNGYWTDTGRTSRWYNVDDNGTGANFGRLEYNISGWSGDANGLSAARQTLVREAFKIYEAVLGIDFVEVGFDDGLVDFFFSDNGSGANNVSTVHSGTGGAIDFSVINVAASWNGGTSVIGDYTFQTILHEIGHALGLGHQGNYNGSGGFLGDALYENDSWALSMMSYFDQVENSASSTAGYDYARLISPMTVDWLALNNLYDGQDYVGRSFGVNQAFTGNTVWGFNTNITSGVSAAFADLANLADTNAFTIVDGGGYDTVDFSGFSADQKINLIEASSSSTLGSSSNIGGLTGNMNLAIGTIIEAAIGGSGNDTIYGNEAGNVLTGNAGNDIMKGMGGGDVLYGGLGNDTLYGDDGLGSADIADSLYGGDGNDEIHMGSSGAGDYVQGDAGDDTVYWGTPSPTNARTVYGGSGIDTINGGGTNFGAVTFDLTAGTYNNGASFTETWSGFENYNNTSGTGAETVIGTTGDNLIQFGSGNNSAYGGGGLDTIYGGAGNDTLEGGFVTDNVYGGDGNDLLLVRNGEFYDNSYGGAGTDTLDHSLSSYGGSTFDFEAGTITGPGINGASAVLEGIEVYYDGSSANTIISDGNSNTYYGGDGNDTMIAEVGGEFMYGGNGVDTIDLRRWNGVYAINMLTGSSNYGSELYLGFENLLSGDGGDTITGNDAVNNINTGNGNDTLSGLAGADILNGAGGSDTVDYSVASTVVVVHLDTPTQYGQYGSGGGGAIETDTLISIENVTTGSGADYVYGSAGDNVINTGANNDAVYAGNGVDTINTGSGLDYVEASYGADIIDAGTENDKVYGGADNDIIYGGDGNDSLYGDHGVDELYGGNGDDLLFIDSTDVLYDGGAGVDRIVWNDAVVAANLDITAHSADYFYGYTGNDIITAVGALTRSELHGGGGNDTLTGSNGVGSYLLGEAGNDRLISGTGIDYIVGGAGADTIVFLPGGGTDYVYDFKTGGADRVDFTALAGAGIHSLADLIVNTAYAASGWFGYSYGTGTAWLNTSAIGSTQPVAGDFLFA